jgi:hypothetical protein
MKIQVTVDSNDGIETHEIFERLFSDSKGGIEPIEFSGTFRFTGDFYVSQQHRSSQVYGSGRETTFGLIAMYPLNIKAEVET